MAEKRVTAACVAGLSDVQACVLWLDMLYPGGNLVCFLRLLMKALMPSQVSNAQQVAAACGELLKRGYVKCVRQKATADHCEYRSVVRRRRSRTSSDR